MTAWTEYDPAFFGDTTGYNVACDEDGNPVPGAVAAYAYDGHTESPTAAQLAWGASVEYRTIERCADGRDWAISKAYGNRNLGFVWPVETIRAECANVLTGEFLDLTHLLPAGPSGVPFCPKAVPDSGEWEFRIWGQVWTDAKQTGISQRDHPFFYQCNLVYGQIITNPCWTGSGANSVLAVIMREAWWDPKGWTRGVGTALPWLDGVVADPGIVSYTGWQAWGKGRGVLWAYRYSDYNTALAYSTGATQPTEPTVSATLDDVVAVLKEIRDELRAAPPPPPPPEGPTGSTGPTGPTGPTGITVPPPPPPPPPPGPPQTYTRDLPWESTTSATRVILQMRCEDTFIVHFKTPAGTFLTPGSINLKEYGSARCWRVATISKRPGDFLNGMLPYQMSVDVNFVIGGPAPYPGQLSLDGGTDYYINIRNVGCTPGASAQAFLDLMIPR